MPNTWRTPSARSAATTHSPPVRAGAVALIALLYHVAAVLRWGAELYAEGARQPRVMAIAVHPYISGVPRRIKYLEAGRRAPVELRVAEPLPAVYDGVRLPAAAPRARGARRASRSDARAASARAGWRRAPAAGGLAPHP